MVNKKKNKVKQRKHRHRDLSYLVATSRATERHRLLPDCDLDVWLVLALGNNNGEMTNTT